MAFTHRVSLRDVHDISEPEKEAIKKQLAGAVDSWVREQPGKRFALRDLIDLDHLDSPGDPCRRLCEKHLLTEKGRQFAMAAAGRGLGWLLKTVLAEDERVFEMMKSVRSVLIRGCQLVGDQSRDNP
jgi:hypothetical protein